MTLAVNSSHAKASDTESVHTNASVKAISKDGVVHVRAGSTEYGYKVCGGPEGHVATRMSFAKALKKNEDVVLEVYDGEKCIDRAFIIKPKPGTY